MEASRAEYSETILTKVSSRWVEWVIIKHSLILTRQRGYSITDADTCSLPCSWYRHTWTDRQTGSQKDSHWADHRRRSDWNSGWTHGGTYYKSPAVEAKKHIFLHWNASNTVLKILQHDKIWGRDNAPLQILGTCPPRPPRDLRPWSWRSLANELGLNIIIVFVIYC